MIGVVDYLRRHGEIEKRLGKNKKLIFYATDDVGKFRELGRKFLGKRLEKFKKLFCNILCPLWKKLKRISPRPLMKR